MENEAKIERLNQRLETVCDEYVELFCQKQGLSFEGWFDNALGSEAKFNSGHYFFRFSEIVLDVNYDIPKGVILKWYSYFSMMTYKDVPRHILSYRMFVKNQINFEFYPKKISHELHKNKRPKRY